MKTEMEVSKKQLLIIEKALDLYLRVGIGQVEIVAEILNEMFPEKTKDVSQWDMKKKYLDPMKEELFGLSGGGSFGICNDVVSDNAKIAYDLNKTIQKFIATKDNHSETSVWHDGNLLKLGSEPVVVIKDTE